MQGFSNKKINDMDMNLDAEYFKEKFGKGWLNKWRVHKTSVRRKREELEKSVKVVKDVSYEPLNNFKSYCRKVKYYTEKVVHMVDGYDKDLRGFRKFHIDHMISKKFGFNNGIPPEFIGDISNLQFIDGDLNVKKNTRNHITESNAWILDKKV